MQIEIESNNNLEVESELDKEGELGDVCQIDNKLGRNRKRIVGQHDRVRWRQNEREIKKIQMQEKILKQMNEIQNGKKYSMKTHPLLQATFFCAK